MRSLALILLGVFSLPLLALSFDDDPNPYSFAYIFWAGERLDSASETPPQGGVWQPIKTPDSWMTRPISTPANMIAWYRFKIPKTLPAEHKQAVFLDRALNNIELYFNDDYLGNGGKTTAPIARNWNKPNLFKIPASSWREGENYLFVRLLGDAGSGLLSPPILGEYNSLESQWYEPKLFVRIELSRVSLVLMMIISLFSLLLYRFSGESILLYAGLASGLWLVPLAYTYVDNIPLAHNVFLRVTHWCIEACALCVVLFVRAKYALPTHRFIRFCGLYLAVVALILVATPNDYSVAVANSLHFISQALLLYHLLITAKKWLTSPTFSDFSLLLGLIVLCGFFIHDVSLSLSQSIDRWFYDPHLGHLSIPAMFILLCLSVANQYKHYIQQAKALNKQLQQRLDTKKQQLSQQIQQRQSLLSKQQASVTRENIYNDLHDDLGARLLSLVYSSPEPGQNDLARSALQDLRDVVSRATQSVSPLDILISDVINEQQSRCDKLDIALITKLTGLEHPVEYSAQQSLQFKRLCREVVGVCIHQLSPSTIHWSINVGLTGLEMIITIDDAKGDLEIISLTGRTKRMGGSLDTHHQNQQLQMVCWVPNHPN